MNKIRGEFIRRVMEDELGVNMLKAQSQAMAKRLNFSASSRLQGSRSVSVNVSGYDAKAVFTHPGHERALDINMNKRYRGKKGWRKKPLTYWESFGVHNRFIHGHYYRLAYRLMFGFTNDAIDTIKEELKGDI